METLPTIGRVVQYRIAEGANAGELRPAMVIRVFITGLVSLAVFLDGSNDGLSETVAWKHDVKRGNENGEWDWMPFQKDQMARAKPDTIDPLSANTNSMETEEVKTPEAAPEVAEEAAPEVAEEAAPATE